MKPTAPDGSTLPRRHVAHFLATLTWAGCTLSDDGERLTLSGPRAGLLQPEVDKRAGAIRAWWQATGGA
jgi:hypothetical protein